MKKFTIISILSILLILCGCNFGNKEEVEYKDKFEIEEDASITIGVYNEQYGKEIVNLFDETYPEHKGKLKYIIQKEYELSDILNKKQMYPDIYMIRDSYLGSGLDNVKSFEIDLHHNMEYLYPLDYAKQINIDSNIYIPMQMHGPLFVVNDETLKNNSLTIEDMNDYDNIKDKDLKIFYYSDFIYQYPYISNVYEIYRNFDINDNYLNEDSFYESLELFKEIYNNFNMVNEPSKISNFYEDNAYLGGLVNEWSDIELYEIESNKKFYYSPVFDINGNESKTIAYSKGYVLNKNCEYIELANEVMRLIRSKEGIQIYINTNDSIIAIEDEKVNDFEYDNIHYSEKIIAYNSVLVQPIVAINAKSSKTAFDFVYDIKFANVVNEYLNDIITIEDVQKQLNNNFEEWKKENK